MQQWDLRHDYHSYANSDAVRVRHVSLELAIDFELKQLTGEARLEFEHLASPEAEGARSDGAELILDTRALNIISVTDTEGRALEWAMGEGSAVLGTPLVITLRGDIRSVVICYHTSADAEGLQWLDGRQTQSGKPFLFSQSQPINARSWIPLQDTPKARITFDARVRANRDCRIVMSALNAETAPQDGVFQFVMEKPMPTHLLALAAGELVRIEIGPRSAVFAEPATAALAATEFEDIEAMMQMADSILGPYAWGRYDMLILPPSFPFGGMENPCLAFLTPTLIAGDKSLVSTVAHELAHSWTGNLVSNATWRDLWLNEGFTTYFTNRIVEAVYGKEQAGLELMIEYGRLKEEMASMPLERQTLPANVQAGDPNEAFNRFTYDKASMFVHFLEARLGREAFDRFLNAYIAAFAFVAITTEDFVDYARNTLLKQHGDKLTEAELLEWIYGEGLPDSFCAPTSTSLVKVEQAIDSWRDGAALTASQTRHWRVQHWQYFLSKLPQQIPQARLIELDDSFALGRSGNAEIACDWLRVAIRNHYDPAVAEVEDFLCRIGRAKFVRPLFLELQIAGYHSELKAIYDKARPGFHPSLSVQLDRLLTQS
ncbi:leukotriene A4 hydrolase C-terminal domain-containing protein [Shewanella sp. JM162201]|uniref:Aminopeptidase N n=1 Tax=Shewanella jiangmenensis TaxID=2837387 RepID=A0ABS5UYZ1_9GAMM|nr:M1 family metallopeptidase [Shewanella jiangmenensis]MBT1443335.1 leukotriene A4 hydrolase C-terminal domain-containing protein [Shewanella jiangmenensis]